MAETETGNGIKAKGAKDAEEHVYTPQITVRPKKKNQKQQAQLTGPTLRKRAR